MTYQPINPTWENQVTSTGQAPMDTVHSPSMFAVKFVADGSEHRLAACHDHLTAAVAEHLYEVPSIHPAPDAARCGEILPAAPAPRRGLRVLAVVAAAVVPAVAAAAIAYDAGSAEVEAAVVTETVTETHTERVEVEPDRWQSCEDLALLMGWSYETAEDAGAVFETGAEGYDTSGVGYTAGEGCAVVWSAQILGAGE